MGMAFPFKSMPEKQFQYIFISGSDDIVWNIIQMSLILEKYSCTKGSFPEKLHYLFLPREAYDKIYLSWW